ncbi:hypothetical protein ACWCW7_34510 [Nocardia tengchongensis]
MSRALSTYLLALLSTESGSMPRLIGERVWDLHITNNAEVPCYLRSVKATNPEKSRAFEVASDIEMLMNGVPA